MKNKGKITFAWVILGIFLLGSNLIYAGEEKMFPAITNPSWFPDGSKIVFTSDIRGEQSAIWIVNANGSGSQQLTHEIQCFDPSFSPDGSTLVFASDKAGNLDIWSMKVDGTELIQLATELGRDDNPSWSPDGSRIAYSHEGTIWLMNRDGSEKKQLTSWGRSPHWSPDGSAITFSHSRGEFINIWKIDVDGTGLTQLTTGDWTDVNPKWSPKGDKILFASNREAIFEATFNLWIMNSDGSNLERVNLNSENLYALWFPSWSPDGDRIVFSGLGESANIWIMDARGYNLQQITHFVDFSLPFSQFSLKHWRIHWDQGKHDKNKFHLSGRIDLPDDYTLDMLQKKGVVTIAIEKKDSAPFSQTATLDFKQNGPIWRYKAPKAQTSGGGEPLDIEKMLIFWQPEGLEDKPDKQGHAGKGHSKRAGWFMIQGNINISDTDQAALLPKAALTLNIPVENITTAGALESREEIEFKVHKNLWSYNAAPHNRWQDWQESWWEKVKED